MPNVVIWKNWLLKGLCSRCFICVRPPPLLWPHTPPLTHCIRVYSIPTYSHRKGGGPNQREDYRGNRSQSRSKIPTWLTVSPVYKPVKTTFRVLCLYCYLVHDFGASTRGQKGTGSNHTWKSCAGGVGCVGNIHIWTLSGSIKGAYRAGNYPCTETTWNY